MDNMFRNRFRRPESLEMVSRSGYVGCSENWVKVPRATYAGRTTTVKNYGNQNAWQERSKNYAVKRDAVRKAYNNVRKIASKFNVPCVKKTFGEEIVRVCCRTIEQLDNIGSILEELMKVDFVMEIGMPLEYVYKMKSLVLFIKPKHKFLRKSLEHAFEESNLEYSCITIEVKYPSVAARKLLKDLETNNSVQKEETIATIPQNGTNMSNSESAGERKREMEKLHTTLLILTIGIIVLLLYIMFEN